MGTAAPNCDLNFSLQRVGLPVPGGRIRYQCLWCDPCRDAVNFVLLNALDPPLELVSAVSKDAQVAIDGQTVRFLQSQPSGGTDLASIVAKIDADAAPGTEVCNLVVVSDGLGRSVPKRDCFIVRPGRSSLHHRLRVSGPTEIRSGGVSAIKASYAHVPESSAITVELPERVSVAGFVGAAPTSIDGRRLRWEGLPKSGFVKVQVRVDAGLPIGEFLSFGVTLTEPDDVFRQQHDVVIVGAAPLVSGAGLDLRAPGLVRQGQQTTITARYREIVPPAEFAVALPAGMSLVRAVPGGEFDGTYWRWSLGSNAATEAQSGSIKLRVAVAADASVDSGLGVVGHLAGRGYYDMKRVDIGVRPALADTNGGGRPSFSVSAPRAVKAGLTGTLKLRYRSVPAPATVELDLPPGMTMRSSLPLPNGSQPRWTTSTDTDAISVEVFVDADLEVGQVLPVAAHLVRTDGSRSTSTAEITVR